jgi:hypothetical protein
MNERIAELKRRFAEEGFRVDDASGTPGFPFLYSASAVRFGYVGIPTFLEMFFVFEEFGRLTSPLLRRFVDGAAQWALENENMMPPAEALADEARRFLSNLAGGEGALESVDLGEMSARQVTCLLYVYPVAVSSRITREVMAAVWSKGSPLRLEASVQRGFVVPVVYDPGREEVHHFRRPPVLGKVYYSQAVRTIGRYLKDPPAASPR